MKDIHVCERDERRTKKSLAQAQPVSLLRYTQQCTPPPASGILSATTTYMLREPCTAIYTPPAVSSTQRYKE